jgi:hypothetical protein
MAIDLQKLSSITHEVNAKIGEDEVTIFFRGASVRAHRELEKTDTYYEEEVEQDGKTRKVVMIRKPEYLTVFVTQIVSGDTSLQPDADYWLDAQPEFLDAVYEAVTGAQNPPKATPSESATTS